MKVGDKRMTESSNIICLHVVLTPGFPSGSTGKESALSARDLGLIPGLGRSPGGEHFFTLLFHFHQQAF